MQFEQKMFALMFVGSLKLKITEWLLKHNGAQMQVLRTLQQGFVDDTLVSPDMYKQAARNWGDPTRLQHFFRKLLRGESLQSILLQDACACLTSRINVLRCQPIPS